MITRRQWWTIAISHGVVVLALAISLFWNIKLVRERSAARQAFQHVTRHTSHVTFP